MNRRMESTSQRPPLWSGLNHDTVSAILADAENRWARTGQVLQTAGQPGTRLFLVRNGRARYYHITASGDEILLRILAPGDVFGLVALLTRPMQYMVNVDAISDCDLLSWGHRTIRSFVSSHPQLAENALHISLGYLKAYVPSRRQRKEVFSAQAG